MVMKSISSIKAKFLRSKIETPSTNLFDNISSEYKSNICERIDLCENEDIIIYTYLSMSYWWVLTNLRVIINEDGKITYVNLADLVNVEPKEIFESSVSKLKGKSIDLILKDGDMKIYLESGTWNSIYNILKYVISQ